MATNAEAIPAVRSGSAVYQAFRVLQAGFVAAPILAGLDKFLNLMTDWSQYLWPAISTVIPSSVFLGVVGVIEMAAGIVVAVRPRFGGYLVSAWLVAIILNLVLLGAYWDVALRDLGLAIGAFALARLATEIEG